MKKSMILAGALLVLASCAPKQARWTEEKANQWYDAQGWLVGCDYIPSDAINQIEMWSSDTYNHDLIDKELSWAEDLGFNTLRVYLSRPVWTIFWESANLIPSVRFSFSLMTAGMRSPGTECSLNQSPAFTIPDGCVTLRMP